MPRTTACNRDLLIQSLADALSDQHEEELLRHLAECEACRRELERLASDDDVWAKVGRILKLEASLDRADFDDCGASDFAVDFLEPSIQRGAIGRIGDVDIVEVIGRGAMGIVLKGVQHESARCVAVKVLAPHLATSQAARRRFAREAQAAAVITHANVMPILSVNGAGKLPYLLMPYVPCESLAERIVAAGVLEPIDVLRIALQVARGLAAAHALGLVHRDVKPANILLEKGVERVMLTDFGLARAVDDASLTRTGVIAGTPQYMSPEQARGEAVDARSDLFSLGSVMYAMCTGRPPFRAETTFGILRRITDSQPRAIREINRDVPEWLATVIGRLLAKDAARRFASAEELAATLEQCVAHVEQPALVRLPRACRPPRGRPRFRVWAVGLTLSAIALACVALAMLFVTPAREAAQNQVDQGQRAEADPRSVSASAPADTPAGGASAVDDWNDATAAEIRDLTGALEQLERRADQPWETLP